METVTNAAALQDQFLNLLVTQLRHQDPLEPTKQEDFLGQLAQFATVDGIEKLNANFEQFSEAQQGVADPALTSRLQNVATATNFIGKNVVFAPVSNAESETGEVNSGIVDAVIIENDNVFVRVDEALIPLDQIREITADTLDANGQ